MVQIYEKMNESYILINCWNNIDFISRALPIRLPKICYLEARSAEIFEDFGEISSFLVIFKDVGC